MAVEVQNWGLENMGNSLGKRRILCVNSLKDRVDALSGHTCFVNKSDKEAGILHAEMISELFLVQKFDSTLAGAAEATLNFCNFVDAHNRMCRGWNMVEIQKCLARLHSHCVLTLCDVCWLKAPPPPPTIRLCWKHC